MQLLSDRSGQEQPAMLVEHAITDLGDDELETLVGASAEEALRVTDRLRTGQQDHSQSRTLKHVEISRAAQALIRGALLNLAYGRPMDMPSGMTQAQMADIFEVWVPGTRSRR